MQGAFELALVAIGFSPQVCAQQGFPEPTTAAQTIRQMRANTLQKKCVAKNVRSIPIASDAPQRCGHGEGNIMSALARH